jgi:8-oxo-dGTP pyrophosphatase MutT (NUDIX family)
VRREFSAGGVLVRQEDGQWLMAAIRPAGRPDVWALPKGRIDEGESGEQTALREVAEETGAHGRSLGKLGDVRYWFHWEGERVFKVVSFFLLVYERGRLGDVQEEFRHEIDEVGWLRLDEAETLLTHKGEREMAGRAAERLAVGDGV